MLKIVCIKSIWSYLVQGTKETGNMNIGDTFDLGGGVISALSFRYSDLDPTRQTTKNKQFLILNIFIIRIFF